MKKLHLICNAHLDPVWMWDFDDGIAATLSTFCTAAEFCDEYDYIFCHNEVILYEYIETYEPELFEKIKRLVKEGKWHIMGGWYLQPDCHLPNGESFIRQMRSGTRYFLEKFGVRPETAINFDSFGHSRGLVQILNKSGFKNYLICRPMPNYLNLPSDQFNWVGYDGSKVKVCRIADDFMYVTDTNQAKEFILKKSECWKDYDAGVALWGVGNHGGNPSRRDLKEVNELIKETKEFEILHSTPDNFFNDVKTDVDYDGQLSHFLIGCYSSLTSIKQKNIELETQLYMTEKLCAAAELNGYKLWNENDFKEAEKALLTLEFHDSLSGTVVESAERSVLYHADHALHLLRNLKQKAFFAMVNGKVKAGEGVYPIFVFNPSAHKRETVVECEILVLEKLVSDTDYYEVTVKHNGKVIPNQVIKEESNINYDRRKRIAFKAELQPLAIDRFDVTFKIKPMLEKVTIPEGDIVVEDSVKRVVISRKTGLIESFVVNGEEHLSGGAFLPVLYEDNADPWGWDMNVIGSNPKEAKLCNKGIFSGLKTVNVIENGDILTEVEALFKVSDSTVRIGYKIYKDIPFIDVNADVLWNEREGALKLKIPSKFGKFIGQTAYGTDEFERDTRENVAQRFIALTDGEKSLSIFNNCTYGCSADEENLYITLLRGVGYCAHPIDDRQIIRDDIYIPYAEQGKHCFAFRMSANNTAENDRLSQDFCEKVYAVNAFPDGCGKEDLHIEVINPEITLSAFFKENEAYVLRLFNNDSKSKKSGIIIGECKTDLEFGKYEIKTVYFKNGEFSEEKDLF